MIKVAGLPLLLVSALVAAGGCLGDIQPGPPSQPDVHVVFEAAYSKAGRFTVTEDRNGQLGAGITGTTGVDDPKALRPKFRRSLVDTHRALLPHAEVPPALVKLNERFTAQYARGTQHTPLSASLTPLATAEAPVENVAVRIRETTPAERFYGEFCRYRNDTGFSSVPTECWYLQRRDRHCYWLDWDENDGSDAFPAAFAQNDGAASGSLWGQSVALGIPSGQWALAVLTRESQEVCFDYEGNVGDFGITKSWGQFDN